MEIVKLDYHHGYKAVGGCEISMPHEPFFYTYQADAIDWFHRHKQNCKNCKDNGMRLTYFNNGKAENTIVIQKPSCV
jgi:hypothetical protein